MKMFFNIIFWFALVVVGATMLLGNNDKVMRIEFKDSTTNEPIKYDSFIAIPPKSLVSGGDQEQVGIGSVKLQMDEWTMGFFYVSKEGYKKKVSWFFGKANDHLIYKLDPTEETLEKRKKAKKENQNKELNEEKESMPGKEPAQEEKTKAEIELIKTK